MDLCWLGRYAPESAAPFGCAAEACASGNGRVWLLDFGAGMFLVLGIDSDAESVLHAHEADGAVEGACCMSSLGVVHSGQPDHLVVVVRAFVVCGSMKMPGALVLRMPVRAKCGIRRNTMKMSASWPSQRLPSVEMNCLDQSSNMIWSILGCAELGRAQGRQ